MTARRTPAARIQELEVALRNQIARVEEERQTVQLVKEELAFTRSQWAVHAGKIQEAQLAFEQEEAQRRELKEQLHTCRSLRQREQQVYAAGAIRTAQMESAILVMELRAKKAERERDEANAAYNSLLSSR